jgi:prepilin-type N-terminal cleavage/methylation domain-containing protein
MRGWSLLELILVMVIMGTLAVFVGPMLLNAVNAYTRTQSTVATYGKMRYAMERMVRELGAVRRDPADTTAFDITAMTATNLAFTNDAGTQVTISFGGGNVNLGYAGTATGVLTDQVSAFSLAYFRQDGATAASGAVNVAYVEISMTLADGPTTFANRRRVAVRNPQ